MFFSENAQSAKINQIQSDSQSWFELFGKIFVKQKTNFCCILSREMLKFELQNNKDYIC